MYSTMSQPSILIPYQGPGNKGEFDIFVMMRPSTNGYYAESKIFSHLRSMPGYKKDFTLVYLANLPGEFITSHKLISHYYSNRIYFTRKGKPAFTPFMRIAFENHFNTPFDSARLVSSFEALDMLDMSKKELFNTWVPRDAVCKILGQTIKKIQGSRGEPIFVLNYDIPHLLYMYGAKTNIAVMCFRTCQPYKQFTKYLTQVYYSLRQDRDYLQSIGETQTAPLARLFHYSHGPLEEISDAGAFMITHNQEQIALVDTSFGRFLSNHGYSSAEIVHLVKNPLCRCMNVKNNKKEISLFDFTRFASYKSALSTIRAMNSQFCEIL